MSGTLVHSQEQLVQEAAISELQLKDALSRFELISSSASEGLFDTVCPHGKIEAHHPVWWSAQMRAIVGYKNERDFPNVLDSWMTLLHPEDLKPTLRALLAHVYDVSDRTPYEVEYRLRTRSGEYRWFSSRGRTQRGPGGKPLRLAGSIKDIHVQKLQQMKIQRTAETLQRALNGVYKGVSELKEGAVSTAEDTSTRSARLIARGRDIQKSVAHVAAIAETTNLLSLNAKLEAVRAGSAGRGFEVVANEIRRLSDRSTEVTREIAGSVSAICEGISENASAMERFRAIVAQIDTIHGTLSAAVAEEAAGSGGEPHRSVG